MRTEDCIGRSLAVQSETRAVTLEAQKLQFAIAISLRDVWIEIQKVVNVAAVAGKVDHLPIGDSSADGLVGAVDERRFRSDFDCLLRRGYLQHCIGTYRV